MFHFVWVLCGVCVFFSFLFFKKGESMSSYKDVGW